VTRSLDAAPPNAYTQDMKRSFRRGRLAPVALVIAVGAACVARPGQAGDPQPGNKTREKDFSNPMSQTQNLGYDDTPFLPGGKWRVHDGKRPQPRVVTPGPAGAPIPPPADAIVLFDGKDLSKWRSGNGGEAGWKIVEDGAMEVVRGAGDISTRDEFGDCQLHIEWRSPAEVRGSGQGRANSGLFLMGRYEVQILDNYDNPTYPDGTAGAIYGQVPPLVNACRKPGEWNTYDVLWTAPRFEGDKLVSPAKITVIFNGIVVQNAYELIGGTPHKQVGTYTPHGPTGPIRLQDHGDPVRFRNIWIRPLKAEDRS
jgi:hypothetical protein